MIKNLNALKWLNQDRSELPKLVVMLRREQGLRTHDQSVGRSSQSKIIDLKWENRLKTKQLSQINSCQNKQLSKLNSCYSNENTDIISSSLNDLAGCALQVNWP